MADAELGEETVESRTDASDTDASDTDSEGTCLQNRVETKKLSSSDSASSHQQAINADNNVDVVIISENTVRRSSRLAALKKSNDAMQLMNIIGTTVLDHQNVIDMVRKNIDGVDVSIETLQNDVTELNEFRNQFDSMYEELQVISDNKVDTTVTSMYTEHISELKTVEQHLQQRIEQLEVQQDEEKELQDEEAAMQEMRKQLEEKMRLYKERKQSRQRLAPISVLSLQSSHSSATSTPTKPENCLTTNITEDTTRKRIEPGNARSPQPPPSTRITSSRPAVQIHDLTLQQLQSDELRSHSPVDLPQPREPNSGNVDVKSKTHNDLEPIHQLAQCLVTTMKSTKRTALEPSIFTGNPLEFNDWEIDFEGYIEAEGLVGKEPLRYLKKYVSGEAKDCISGYFTLNSEAAYKDARKQLRRRYGKDSSIARAMRTKLENWPNIGATDGKQLRKYADFLSQIKGAMISVPKLKALNDSDEIEKIAKVLPRWMKTKWVNLSRQLERNEDREADFHDYHSLINEQAEIQNTPLMANDRTPEKTRDDNKRRGKAIQHTTLTTATTDKSVKHCAYCEKDNHDTASCFKLIAMSHRDTIEVFKKKRLCFSCAQPHHMTSQCKDKAKCRKCKGDDLQCLHKSAQDWEETKVNKGKQEPKTVGEQKPPSDTKEKISNAADSSGTTELLNMVVPVYISAANASDKILAYAVLDNGSDSTYIAKDIAKRLKPPSVSEQITVTTLNGKKTSHLSKYKIVVDCFEGAPDGQDHRIEAYEQDVIPCNRMQIPTSKIASSIPLFKEISQLLPPKLDAPIGLLIGRDFAHLLAPHETIIGKENEPFALKTVLGWTLCGGNNEHQRSLHTTLLAQASEFDDLDDRRKMSQNDIKFTKTLENGMERSEDGSITLPLPFKDQPTMPNNKAQAKKRLEQLIHRLKKDPNLKKDYFQFMEEVIKSGHAEKVPDHCTPQGKAWYLPHFGVYHPMKQKLRVVFDASVKFLNRCLNDELLAGPDHINSLLGILLRFRTKHVALSCDIEKMFHNFKVLPEHRDYLRFLWVDPNLTTVTEYRMTVHLFGATSSPGVATFALRKIAAQATNDLPEASKFITRNFYVDDGITSVASVPEAIQLARDATKICGSANLRLHKFVSNSRELLQSIPTTEIAKGVQGLDLCKDKLPAERTLGMEWRTDDDCFTFSSNLLEKPNTKRGILSMVSQVYDPLGLLAPFLLKGKVLMQRACKKVQNWDEAVSEDLAKDWTLWKEQLSNLQDVSIPRCLKPQDFGEVKNTQLHYFCDASLDGYGACAYLRMINKHDKVHVALVMAKSRVAPLKPMTIPRLELQAAVEATRLKNQLQVELDLTVDAEHFWSDSTVALGFISNTEAQYHMFVANRVAEIRRSTDVAQWHHIPGSLNPADLASRGCNLTLLNKSNWWSGPAFLRQLDISEHISDDVDHRKYTQDSVEVKKVKQTLSTVATVKANMDETIKKFSSWKRLVRALALVKAMLKSKSFKKPTLIARDWQEAEDCIVKAEQERLFPEDIKRLKGQEKLAKNSKLLKFTPYLDEKGTMRMRGRVTSPLSYKEINPVILTKSSLAKLLVTHYHQITHHQGHNPTIAALRQAGFWVTGVSTLAKNIVHHCIRCRRNRAKPEEQQMGLLPKERTNLSPPFTHVGIDTFGHFLVKERRTELKRYGVLFTCLYSRALHIEVVDDLSTDSFLQALRRIQAVRGPITTIFSDGGTNFTGARNQLEKDLLSMQDSKIKIYLLANKIQFQINTPTASHQGGIWERQIRIIRSILNGMTTKYDRRMTTEGLRTALYEIMATVNSIPLSTASLSDTEAIITANHLLTMKSQHLPPPPGQFDGTEIYGRSMYRKTQQMAEEFWTTWKAQYLPKIENRPKWEAPRQNIKVGDLVVIVDNNEPRNSWKTGVVVAVHQGSDGLVRKTSIMTGTTDLDTSGKPRHPRVTLDRPVQKLIRIMSAE